MPQQFAASARDIPPNTWAIARIRHATRPSSHRFASRRNSADERSRPVTSIARANLTSCANQTSRTVNQSYPERGIPITSHDFGRLVLEGVTTLARHSLSQAVRRIVADNELK